MSKKKATPNKVNPVVSRRFSFDAEGYSSAQAWLKEIGEWERVSTSGVSTDGWSIIETANVIFEKINGLKYEIQTDQQTNRERTSL